MKDPLADMIVLSNDQRDHGLMNKWALWTMKYDSERALNVLRLL